MRSRLYSLAAAAAFTLVAAPAFGQVTVGVANSGNCLPWSCSGLLGLTDYQQVYAATAFSGPMWIGSVRFFDTQNPGAVFSGQSFTVSFTTTASVTPSNITNANMAANAANSALFFSGILTGPATALIYGAAYYYDPSQGNLLLDVQTTGTQGDYSYLDLDQGGTSMGRAFNGYEGFEHNFGLVTQFDGAQTVTPEPATIALLGTGLLGIGVIRRRRRNKTA